MSANRNYDDSDKETSVGNASHQDKRQRTDKSLEESYKSEQAQTDEEKEEETEVSEEPMEDSASETKPASWSFLDGIDKELLERVAAANEGGSQSESLEESDLESEEVSSDDGATLILPFLNVGSKFEDLCGEGTGARGITTPLCTFCHHIFDNWDKVVNSKDPQGPVIFPHCRDPLAIEEFANDGCSLCTQFLQAGMRNPFHTRRERREALEEYEKVFGDAIKFPSGIVKVTPGWYKGKYNKDTTYWCLDLVFEHPKGFWKVDRLHRPPSLIPEESYDIYMMPAGAPNHTPHSEKGATPSSEDALLLAKKWFESCCSFHERCNIRKRLFRPTRLVYIGDNVSRLRLSPNYEAGVKYATLSHCWGITSLPTLVTGNLQQFQTEIPDKALSKTFKDAIHIGKVLDIQYLWIDSLCIVQNDSDDWRKESSLMYHVYSNSTMNIAASGASDGTQGCFFERSQTWICQIGGLCEQEELIYGCVPGDKYTHDMATPLESRGWTFQERHLASRTLHFTAGEVYWECYHTNACETFPAGFAPEFVHGLDHQAYRLKTPISTASWESLVNMYSRRKLTFSSDKLVALSGMAQAIHFQNNDEYVAGMWRSKLEGQLCWSLGNNGQAKDGKETVPYRAPTWSWASVDGEIRFNVNNFDASKAIVNIKVLEVEIVRPGPDLFGAICFAKLLISCIMVVHGEVVFGKSYSGATIYWLEVEGSRIDFYPQLDRLDVHEGAISAVHLLPLLGWGGLEEIHGLMLDPTGQTQGEYQRTGYFTLKAWEARKFETICMKQMRRMEDGSYSQGELYKTKGRIITLI